jgi:hypothetical protein
MQCSFLGFHESPLVLRKIGWEQWGAHRGEQEGQGPDFTKKTNMSIQKNLILTDKYIPVNHLVSLAPVAQLDRAPGFEPVGRRFESCRARRKYGWGPLAQLVEQLTLNQ